MSSNSNNQFKKVIFSTGPNKIFGAAVNSKKQQEQRAVENPKAQSPKNRPKDDEKTRREGTEYEVQKRLASKASYIIQNAEESIQRGEVQTEEQIQSVEWARGQVALFGRMKVGKAAQRRAEEEARAKRKAGEASSSKRDRSKDESRTSKRLKSAEGITHAVVKRPNPYPAPTTNCLDRMPYNEVVRQHLKVSLVDTSKPDLRS